MAKHDLEHGLTSPSKLAAYLEARSDEEIIADIKSMIEPEWSARDRYAAAALSAIISNFHLMAANIASARAYEFADAMLVARHQTGAEQ